MWHQSNTILKLEGKPLIIYGARQVGKTTLVRDLFAKDHFQKVIYIDFKIDNREEVYKKIYDEVSEKYNDYKISINLDIDVSD